MNIRTLILVLALVAPAASAQVIEEPLGHEAVFDGQNAWPIISRSGPYYGGDPNGAGLNQTLLVQVNGEIWEMVVRNRNVLSLTNAVGPLPPPNWPSSYGGVFYLTEADCQAQTSGIPLSTLNAVLPPNTGFFEENGELYRTSDLARTPWVWVINSVAGCIENSFTVHPSGPGLDSTGTDRLFDPAITKEIVPVGPYSYIPEPALHFGLAVGVVMLASIR